MELVYNVNQCKLAAKLAENSLFLRVNFKNILTNVEKIFDPIFFKFNEILKMFWWKFWK